MSENYFYSSLSAQEIENTLVGAVRFNAGQTLSTSQQAQARQNIGAGSETTGFAILGYYDTLADMQAALQRLPQPGDAYGIGTEAPYDIYIYDGTSETWINNGPVNEGAFIDDSELSLLTTWSSSKINSTKQDKISAVGILKGSGFAVSAATKGTDYGALSFTVTLLAASWTTNTQSVANANFFASGFSYIVSPASTSFSAYGEAQIHADDVTTDGVMVFHCEDVPSADLTINVVRMVSA